MAQAPKPMEIKCGSWLACEGGVSVDELVNCPTAFASKPAPTEAPRHSSAPQPMELKCGSWLVISPSPGHAHSPLRRGQGSVYQVISHDPRFVDARVVVGQCARVAP